MSVTTDKWLYCFPLECLQTEDKLLRGFGGIFQERNGNDPLSVALMYKQKLERFEDEYFAKGVQVLHHMDGFLGKLRDSQRADFGIPSDSLPSGLLVEL